MKARKATARQRMQRALTETNDQGARITKTLKAVLLQCGGSVLIDIQTMVQMEKRYYFLDVEAQPDGLRVSVRTEDEDDDPVGPDS